MKYREFKKKIVIVIKITIIIAINYYKLKLISSFHFMDNIKQQ